MSAFSAEVRTRATEAARIRDITREVAESVSLSGVRDGICTVYSTRSTRVARVNEFESGLLQDFASLLARLVPGRRCRVPDDGWARCVSMLLGPAGESIPVSDGELCLGRWQRVLLFELDGEHEHEDEHEHEHEHEEDWHVQVIGA